MTCKYNIGALKNAIGLTSSPYLVSGVNSVNSITLSNTLYATDIEVDEEQTLDERWQFRRTLAFTVQGYHDETLLSNVSGLIIETSDGVAYCYNPLSTFETTYTYTFSENEDATRYTATTVTNMPMIQAAVTMTVPTVCEYLKDRPDKVAYNERIYSSINNDEVVYTNSGFTVIEDAKNISLSESYANGRRTHSVSFYLPDNQLGNEALAFQNDYSFVVTTTAGHQIAAGFWGIGLEASYAYEDDAVHLAFTGNYEGRGLILTDSLSPVTATHWEYTASEGYFECTGDGIATYILQKEVDALGNASGDYKVLEGHESEIGPEINVVGTFSETTSFLSSKCAETPCFVSTSMPDTLILQPGQSKNFTIKTRDNWSLTGTVVTVMPTTGIGGSTTNIVVSAPASDVEQSGYIDITSCDVTKRINVVVNSTAVACFPQGLTYNINAAAQTIRVASRCPLSEASIELVEDGSARINGKYVEATITSNQISGSRTIPVHVVMADGRQVTLSIIQAARIVEWYSDGTVCDSGDLYALERMYTGATQGQLTPTYTTRLGSLIESGSSECQGEVYRYQQQYYSYCVDGTPYYVVREQVSHDGGDTWEDTGYESLGAVAEGETCPEEEWQYYWELSDVEGCAEPLTTIPKLTLYLTDGTVTQVEYDGNNVLTVQDTSGHVSDILTVSGAVIGNNVKTIDINAFSGFTHLVDVSIPPEVDTLSNWAFQNTFALRNIDLPENIYQVPAACFKDSGLYFADIPQGSLTIGNEAYSNCESLRYVDISDNVTSIDAKAFNWTSQFSVTPIELDIFAVTPPTLLNQLVTTSVNILSGRPLSSITIYVPSGAVRTYQTDNGDAGHGGWAAYGSTTITSRNRIFAMDWLCTIDSVSNTRTHINSTGGSQTYISSGTAASYKATARKVRIDLDCREIQQAAFSGWPLLEEVEFKQNVYTIENDAFRDCVNLRKVVMTNSIPFPEAGTNLFKGCPIQELWLPYGAIAEQWLRYFTELDANKIYFY